MENDKLSLDVLPTEAWAVDSESVEKEESLSEPAMEGIKKAININKKTVRYLYQIVRFRFIIPPS
jgi:hypothetical protein